MAPDEELGLKHNSLWPESPGDKEPASLRPDNGVAHTQRWSRSLVLPSPQPSPKSQTSFTRPTQVGPTVDLLVTTPPDSQDAQLQLTFSPSPFGWP